MVHQCIPVSKRKKKKEKTKARRRKGEGGRSMKEVEGRRREGGGRQEDSGRKWSAHKHEPYMFKWVEADLFGGSKWATQNKVGPYNGNKKSRLHVLHIKIYHTGPYQVPSSARYEIARWRRNRPLATKSPVGNRLCKRRVTQTLGISSPSSSFSLPRLIPPEIDRYQSLSGGNRGKQQLLGGTTR
ncbi:hypothetical protein BHE74_00016041 [Ensete ventricosum]|nr:hypothetical protein BHE74_00016041 [Ensete ventricosum]